MAGQVTVAFLHDVEGDFDQLFVGSVDGGFDFFELEAIEGFLFDEIDLSSYFFEEGLKLNCKTVPETFAFAYELVVIFFEIFRVVDGVTVLGVVFIELAFIFFFAELAAFIRGTDEHEGLKMYLKL